MEAEYITLSKAAKEAKFLRHLLSSVTTYPCHWPCNHQHQLAISSGTRQNNIRHARTKYIDTRHHFIRNIYAAGKIDLIHIPSASTPWQTLRHHHSETLRLSKNIPNPFNLLEEIKERLEAVESNVATVTAVPTIPVAQTNQGLFTDNPSKCIEVEKYPWEAL
jgi:hypothetical protein